MVETASIVDRETMIDESHPCNLCPKTFPNPKLLQQHQQMFHTEKSFICEICGKAFRFRSNLAEHRSVHTALKPYVCKFCGKSSRLKGNLTKHILKHHKKEQSEHIGKDDIIIKKDPTATDFLEQSMLVLSQNNTNTDVQPFSFLPKEEKSDPDYERAIFLSFGLDQGSMDLSGSPDTAASENGAEVANGSQDYVDSDMSSASPLPNTTVGGATSLQALLAQVGTPPPCGSNKTQCTECGKHFRKGSALQLHMTLNHGFPPPGSTGSSDEKASDGDIEGDIHAELRQIKQIFGELVAQQKKIEQAQSTFDTRMTRVEKNLETVLNSMYSLVQLQTGMNSSVTRFRDDACEQLKGIRSALSSSPEK